jgi:ferredoxin
VYRIVIDRDRCVGSGNCLFWAPATFDLDDGGTSVVVDPAGDDQDRIRVAVDGCPTRAITLELVGTATDAPTTAATDPPTDVHNEGGPDADRTD